MKFKVGDRVKFLNENGGGVVSKIVSPSMVNVAIEDGFEIPSISSNWTDLPVHKNANFSINIIAPNTKAHDYQLFINKQGD